MADLNEVKTPSGFNKVTTASDTDMVPVGNTSLNMMTIANLKEVLGINALNRNIQSGAVTITAAANTFTEVNVTFAKTFSSMPMVVCGMKSTTTSLQYNQLAVMVSDVTTTGFKLRVSNNSGTAFAPNIQWIAINN